MTLMKSRRLPLLLCTSACIGAAACSFMGPQQDVTHYFILSPVASGSSSTASAASTARLSIGVGPIRFPGYLNRPGIVTRTTSNRLVVSDEKRWGEPLDRNFESVLDQDLSQMLGTVKITNYPWYADTHIDYQVEVWVKRFEAAEDGRSWLTAIWTIKDGRDGRELASEQLLTTAPVQSGDEAGSVALSQDVGEMSRHIAERIIKLNATPKATTALTS